MTIKSDVLAAQDHISKAIISALEKKRGSTASKLFQVYEQLGKLAKQFPEYSPESSIGSALGSEFYVNAAEPIDYGYNFGAGEDIISFSGLTSEDTISLG